MAWWGVNGGNQAKQKNRFIVEWGNGGKLFTVSSISKPTVTIESKQYKMINHFYNYPGVPKWDPITMKFVDTNEGLWGDGYRLEDDDGASLGAVAGPEGDSLELLDALGNDENFSPIPTSAVLYEMLLASGYVTPSRRRSRNVKPVVSPEKAAMIDLSFGAEHNRTDGSLFKIHQLDRTGKRSTETWTIYNPIITKISWGELDYGDDNLVEYTLDIAYDWAEHSYRHSV